MSAVLDFIKSRPTEVWLGLWTAIVGVLNALGVEINATLAAAVAALIGALLTFIASRTEGLGPEG